MTVFMAQAGGGQMLAMHLALAVGMFVIGAFGVVVRRNPVVVFMCIELMLNAVNLVFLSFARYQPDHWVDIGSRSQSAMTGQMSVIFVMAVAAAEVAVGLGIIMAIFRMRNEVDIDDMSVLKD